MSSNTPRRSTRTSHSPIRFNPDQHAWVPGSINSSTSNIKQIDHWQLRYDGWNPISLSEKQCDALYENNIEAKMLNDPSAKKDTEFVVSDSQLSDTCDFSDDSETDAEETDAEESDADETDAEESDADETDD
jgi:hypothetical protein